jgi:hypothetical protein
MEATEPCPARPVRRLPPAIRGVLYALLMFTVAYLACLAWDFDHLQFTGPCVGTTLGLADGRPPLVEASEVLGADRVELALN